MQKARYCSKCNHYVLSDICYACKKDLTLISFDSNDLNIFQDIFNSPKKEE